MHMLCEQMRVKIQFIQYSSILSTEGGDNLNLESENYNLMRDLG